MATLKEEAQTYESPQTKNIADLKIVDINFEMKEENNVEFPYHYFEIDGVRYRVPVSVLSALKLILEEKPDLKGFRVKKTGEGLKTEYTVIPL